MKAQRLSDKRKLHRLRYLLNEEEVAMRVNEYAPMKGGPCGSWVDALMLWLKGKLHG